jgi:hypothetical protein
MPALNSLLSLIRGAIPIFMLALGIPGVAAAQVYEFNRFVRGGGGGGDPSKQRIVQGAGANICVHIAPGGAASPNRVHFTFWNQFPEPRSRIQQIAFDVGRHSDLFSAMTIMLQSPGVNGRVVPPRSHAMLHGISADYWIAALYPGGITPGKMLVVSATLGSGRTFANVIGALNEGANPATAASGFRIGVTASHILGGPPPGVATINDDGGFLLTGPSARCRTQ